MDSDFKPTVSEAHSETMDFLSRAWCNFAVHQAFQPEQQGHSIVFQDNWIKKFEISDTKATLPSWIWMQEAMHPELNYNSCFRNKWLPWKKMSFTRSVSKWLKEIKKKRKEEERLQRADVHAAMSIAGLAAALAAIAAENSKQDKSNTNKESAVASAAALVAAQCAQVAEAMGGKREQLSTVIGSAIIGTSASDILTLTAAATTSLRGAATLKSRSGCRNRLNGPAPVLPIKENRDFDFEFEKCRSVLTKGVELNIQTWDGKCTLRLVSVILNSEAKVILKIRKLNLLNAFTNKKERIVLDMHAELYKDSDAEETDTCYLIVLTTNRETIKLDMADNYQRYKMWATTINRMLMLSTSFTRYQLQFYKK